MALAPDGSAHVNVTSGSAPSVSLTTTNANDIIVVVATVNGASISSISDDAGLTWSQITSGGGTNKIYLWYAVAPPALSADTITVNLSTPTSFATIDAFGISGADTSTIFDANASTPASGTTGTLSVSTDTAATFIIGGYRLGTASPTEGTGWTKLSGANFQLVEYKIVSTTQSGLSVAIGTGAGTQNGGVADAIIIASAGGGTPITGDLAVTLDDATLSSTGTLALKAALSITLADATLSAAGINPDAATPDTSFLPIVRRRRR